MAVKVYAENNLCMCKLNVTDLEHFLNVVIFSFQQLSPGGKIAVGENSSRFQQSVGMTLQGNI